MARLLTDDRIIGRTVTGRQTILGRKCASVLTRARGSGGGDKAALVRIGHTFPSGAGKLFERAIADLLLPPRCPVDPIAEIDVRQIAFRRPADMVEDNIVPKPSTSLMFRVIEAVNHRQPIALEIC